MKLALTVNLGIPMGRGRVLGKLGPWTRTVRLYEKSWMGGWKR